MTIQDAIHQLVNLGETEPLEIARKIRERHGDEWLVEQLSDEAEVLLADKARMVLGSLRRSATVALKPDEPMTVAELKVQKVWIPDLLGPGVGGHEQMARCTAEMFERRASYLARLAGAVFAQADWFRDTAALMRAEGARTFGKLKAAPPLLGGHTELGSA